MQSIQEGQVGDEQSLSDAISFPSLNNLYLQEEIDIASAFSNDVPAASMDDNIIHNTDGIEAATTAVVSNKAGPGAEAAMSLLQRTDQDNNHLQSSPKSQQLWASRSNQTTSDHVDENDDGCLMENRRAVYSFTEPKGAGKPSGSYSMDDSGSFLANVDVADVESSPDDATFLVNADVEDVTIGDATSSRKDSTATDTCYDMYASALSRASASTKASTIGDLLLKESKVAAQMAKGTKDANGMDKKFGAEDQSASAYSYRRAYVDNITLGSNYTSACSALTDDYCFDARRIGMSDAIKRKQSGPADADTGAMVQHSDTSYEASLARPPPSCQFSHKSVDLMLYEDPDHLQRVISFGGGDGYVDEEALRITMSEQRGNRCCGWFLSSSKMVKLMVLCSACLLFISCLSLAVALLVPEEKQFWTSSFRSSDAVPFPTESPTEGRAQGSDDTDTNYSPTPVPFYVGTTEPSTMYSNTNSPTETLTASLKPTPIPTESPELFTYATSAITGFPTKHPSVSPTFAPSDIPTQQPSKQPFTKPTQLPTRLPIQPSPLPTESPITFEPTASPQVPPSQSLIQTIVTLRATKDAYVNQTAVLTNYGVSKRLRVDGSPKLWSLIGFDTTAVIKNTAQIQRQGQIPSIQVLQAKLRLYTRDEGGECKFFALPYANWTETSLTWYNMQQHQRTGEFRVGSLGWFTASRWHEIDVTDAFQDNLGSTSVETFLIKSSSTNGVTFASRQSVDFSPELVLTVSSDSDDISTNPPTMLPPAKSPWPTYFPTEAAAKPITASPTKQPTEQPAWVPSFQPTASSSLTEPTRQPTTPKPSTTTPHMQSKSPTNIPTTNLPPTTKAPTGSPASPTASPSDTPSEITVEEKSIETSPSSPDFVPPGCSTTADINFAFREAMNPEHRTITHIIFPSENLNNVPSGTFELGSFTRTTFLEFDLNMAVSTTNSAENVSSVSLRLFVESVADTRSISVFKLPPDFLGWDEDKITLDNHTPPTMVKAGHIFEVTSSDRSKWIDVDVTDLISHGSFQATRNIALAMMDISASDDAGESVFASQETCHSPKLVVITEAKESIRL